jgi:hypothetical protein
MERERFIVMRFEMSQYLKGDLPKRCCDWLGKIQVDLYYEYSGFHRFKSSQMYTRASCSGVPALGSKYSNSSQMIISIWRDWRFARLARLRQPSVQWRYFSGGKCSRPSIQRFIGVTNVVDRCTCRKACQLLGTTSARKLDRPVTPLKLKRFSEYKTLTASL